MAVIASSGILNGKKYVIFNNDSDVEAYILDESGERKSVQPSRSAAIEWIANEIKGIKQ